MKRQLTKKEYTSILQESGLTSEEIKQVWMNVERRRK